MAGGSQGKEDDSVIILAVCAGLLMAAVFALSYFRAEINWFVARFKYIETWPFAFWSSDWQELSGDLLSGRADLKNISTSAIAAFYNRYAAFTWWIPLCAFIMWRLWRMPTKNEFREKLTPQTLLERTSRIFSSTYPWVHRDISKKNWNYGVWRLMESPLLFLIRNRAIRDPNGEPFRYNQVFDCGEDPSLYSGLPKSGEKAAESDIFDFSSFEKAVKLCKDNLGKEAGADKDGKEPFVLPKRKLDTPEREVDKFKKSDLVPILDCCYLNSKKRDVPNELDEKVLAKVLMGQLGSFIRPMDRKTGKPAANGARDPFAWLKYEAELDKRTAWRFGLASALYLHGLSDRMKKDAYAIFDAMNYSCGGKDALKPENINIGKAMEIRFEYEKERPFTSTVMKHSCFTNVFFMALIQYARQRGVIETAKFSWVRCFDRSLWYTICQTGRSVACAEAAGVWSHYYAEEALGHPLEEPYMEIAIEGFREEMIIEGYLNRKLENERRIRKKAEIESLKKQRARVADAGYGD